MLASHVQPDYRLGHSDHLTTDEDASVRRFQQPTSTAEPVCLLSQQEVPTNSQDLHWDGRCCLASPLHRLPNAYCFAAVQPYLPANVSLEEGFCMVRQCRSQMPLMRPEPFYVGPELGDAIGVNVDAIAAAAGAPDDVAYNPVHSQAYSNPQPSNPYSGYNSIPAPMVSKPLRRRPPAHIYVGRPLRPGTGV